MPNKYDIVFQQRDPLNTRFLEKVVSGSSLIIQTNTQGDLVGSKNLPPFNISGSAISSSGLFVDGPANLIGSTVAKDLQSPTGSFDTIFFNPNGSVLPPSNSSSPGSEGELRTDDNFLYLYLNGSWRRAPFSLF